MKAYGKTLVNEEPDETTELLKRLCSDYKPLVEKPPDRMYYRIKYNQVEYFFFIKYSATVCRIASRYSFLDNRF